MFAQGETTPLSAAASAKKSESPASEKKKETPLSIMFDDSDSDSDSDSGSDASGSPVSLPPSKPLSPIQDEDSDFSDEDISIIGTPSPPHQTPEPINNKLTTATPIAFDIDQDERAYSPPIATMLSPVSDSHVRDQEQEEKTQ